MNVILAVYYILEKALTEVHISYILGLVLEKIMKIINENTFKRCSFQATKLNTKAIGSQWNLKYESSQSNI